MGATPQEAGQFSTLSSTFIDNIASLLKQVDAIEDDDGFYLAGDIEVRHYDGWRAGYIKSFEDWWIFVPDYKDLTD